MKKLLATSIFALIAAIGIRSEDCFAMKKDLYLYNFSNSVISNSNISKSQLTPKQEFSFYGQQAEASNLCIYHDDSSSMSNGRYLGRTFYNILTAGVTVGTTAITYTPTINFKRPYTCNSMWSPHGDILDNMFNFLDACKVEGAHYVIISDGCSNHRNPVIARNDQIVFNRIVDSLSRDNHFFLAPFQVDKTMGYDAGMNGGAGGWIEPPPDTNVKILDFSLDSNYPPLKGHRVSDKKEPDLRDYNKIAAGVLDFTASTR